MNFSVQLILQICTTDYSGTLVSVTGDRMGVQVTWPDGHVSSFDANWLLERKLPEDKPYSVHGNIIHDGVKLWDKKEMQGNIPSWVRLISLWRMTRLCTSGWTHSTRTVLRCLRTCQPSWANSIVWVLGWVTWDRPCMGKSWASKVFIKSHF